MATKEAKAEAVKVDVFEDDDEFEEFETEGKLVFVNYADLTICSVADMIWHVPTRFSVTATADWGEREQEPEVVQQWEDDWDDDDVNDDFSLQLRAELEKAS